VFFLISVAEYKALAYTGQRVPTFLHRFIIVYFNYRFIYPTKLIPFDRTLTYWKVLVLPAIVIAYVVVRYLKIRLHKFSYSVVCVCMSDVDSC
jgi:hypothetical protein